MALTTLDPKTALIVVDLQKGIAGFVTGEAMASVVERSRALTDAFRARGLPVVLVNVTGAAPGRTEENRRLPDNLPADFAEFVEELGQVPSDLVATKRTWGAFANTDLEQRLRSLGVTQVVVTGVATSAGVESTARQAYEAGFNVTLAIDAMTDRSAEAHDYCVRKVFPRIGETGTADEVIALLDNRA